MFNNNEIEVRFNELVYGEEFRQICEVYPIVSAEKIEKSWWKKMKVHFDVFYSEKIEEFRGTSPTIKYCPGIYDFTNYGYIIPAWQDFQFWIDDDGQIDWQKPDLMGPIDNIKLHSKEQVDTCPILGNTSDYILKLVSPWLISTPKGTSLILCKPFYHYSNDFDVCPGVLDSDMDEEPNKGINAMIRFNVKNKVIHIKAGQPLIQLIPFKRTSWKLKHLEMDKKFKDMLKYSMTERVTKFDRNDTDKDSMIRFRQDNSNKKFK
jgi:hypothetical protein